jgi:hypothetical protein
MKATEVKILDSFNKSFRFTIPLEKQLNLLKSSLHGFFKLQMGNGGYL